MSTIAPPADAVQTEIMQDDLHPEYDEPTLKEMLARGVRRKYAGQARTVTLAPDVAAVFASEEAVNTALRSLIKSVQDNAPEAAPASAP